MSLIAGWARVWLDLVTPGVLELLGMTIAHLDEAEARAEVSPWVPLLVAIRDQAGASPSSRRFGPVFVFLRAVRDVSTRHDDPMRPPTVAGRHDPKSRCRLRLMK